MDAPRGGRTQKMFQPRRFKSSQTISTPLRISGAGARELQALQTHTLCFLIYRPSLNLHFLGTID